MVKVEALATGISRHYISGLPPPEKFSSAGQDSFESNRKTVLSGSSWWGAHRKCYPKGPLEALVLVQLREMQTVRE